MSFFSNNSFFTNGEAQVMLLWNPATSPNFIQSGVPKNAVLFVQTPTTVAIDDVPIGTVNVFVYFDETTERWKVFSSSSSGQVGAIALAVVESEFILNDSYPPASLQEGTFALVSNVNESKLFFVEDGAWKWSEAFTDARITALESLVDNLRSGVKFIDTFNPKTNTPPVPLTPLNANYDSGDYYQIAGLDTGEEYVWNTFTLTNGDWIIVAKVDDTTLEWRHQNLGTLAKEVFYNNSTSGLSAENVQDAIDEVDANLGTETQARIDADTSIDGRLNVIEGDDTTDGSIEKALKDAKDYTDSEIAQEITDRQNADINLQNQIDNIDTQLTDDVVKLTGNQTIAGIKTFTSFVRVPNLIPNEQNEATPKSYVDSLSPTQLTTTERYVSKAGNDSFNGQVNRQKLTIDNALTSLSGSSGNIHIQGGNYDEMLELGTSRSRVCLVGSENSRTVLKQIKFIEDNHQSTIQNIKLENDGTGVGNSGFAIDVQSTLSGFTFVGLSCGGNHAGNTFMNVADGDGYLAIVNCDLSNKIVNLENSTLPRLCFINNSTNFVLNAGTNWTVVVDYNSQNVIELSSNNNVLRGLIANTIIADNTAYNAIMAGGSATDGYYLVNYTEAGVFATGDIILKQDPSVVVVNQHYNTPMATYYLLLTQQTAHKKGGAWVISADTTELQTGLASKQDTITASNGVEKVGNDVRGVDATTSEKGVVQLSNTYDGTSETVATTEKALSDGLATRYTNAEIDNSQTAQDNRLDTLESGTLSSAIKVRMENAGSYTDINRNALQSGNQTLQLPLNSQVLIGDQDLLSALASYYTKTASDGRFQNLFPKVADETAMLALTDIEVGYVVVREDLEGALFRLSATPPSTLENWEQIGGSSGGGAWGEITGTLSDQTDLQSALDGKEDTITNLPYTKGGTGINNLSGQGLKSLRVNSGETGYELYTPAGAGDTLVLTNLANNPSIPDVGTSEVFSKTNSITTSSAPFFYPRVGSIQQILTYSNFAESINNYDVILAFNDVFRRYGRQDGLNLLTGGNTATEGQVLQKGEVDVEFVTLTKNDVGLDNVDNTSDADKPVSTATQTALDLKLDKAGGTIANNLTIEGNLTLDGEFETADKELIIGAVETPTDTTADGGGLRLKGATDKTILWDETNANFTSSENVNIPDGKVYKINNVDIKNTVETLTNKTLNTDDNDIVLGNFNTLDNSGIATGDKLQEALGKLQSLYNGTFQWNIITITANANLTANRRHIIDSASQIELTLDATPTEGAVYHITGKGTGGFIIKQNANQKISIPSKDSAGIMNLETTAGTSGFVLSPDSKFSCTLQYLGDDELGNNEFSMITRNVDSIEIDGERWSRRAGEFIGERKITPHLSAYIYTSLQYSYPVITLESPNGNKIRVSGSNQYSTSYPLIEAIGAGFADNSQATRRIADNLDTDKATQREWLDFATKDGANTNYFYILEFVGRPQRIDKICINPRQNDKGPNAGWVLHGTNAPMITKEATFTFDVGTDYIAVDDTSDLEVGMFVFETPTGTSSQNIYTSLGLEGRYISEIISGTQVKIGGIVNGIDYGSGLDGSNRSVSSGSYLVFQQFNEFAHDGSFTLTHQSRIIDDGPETTTAPSINYENIIDVSDLAKQYSSVKWRFPSFNSTSAPGFAIEIYSLID